MDENNSGVRTEESLTYYYLFYVAVSLFNFDQVLWLLGKYSW